MYAPASLDPSTTERQLGWLGPNSGRNLGKDLVRNLMNDAATTDRIQASYHPSWGRVKSISRPVLGRNPRYGSSA